MFAFSPFFPENTQTNLFLHRFLGYDTGIGGAVSALPSFRRDFGISPSNAPSTISNIVSILFGGAWFGALIFALLSHYIGRRKGLMVATVIFTVGAITQTACKGNLGQMYAGRFITGLGIGAVAEISPTFTAECSSPKWRGRAVAMVEMNLVAGGLLSYWITYATSLHIPPSSSSQWRIPIAIQLIFGGIAFFCTLPMNESPRWLISKGKDSAGLASLAYLRCTNLDDPALLNEFAEIKAQVKEEIEVAKGVTFRELMLPYNRKRLFISTFLGLWGIWTAHTALVVYAPTIFQQIGFSQATTSLLASGVFATLKFVVTIIAIALTVDRFGRVVSMCVGLISTGTIFFSLAAIQATHPPRAEGNISAASKAMMALIYLHVIIYSFTMGPMPWIYSSEIFPLRLREIGQMAFSVGTCESLRFRFHLLNSYRS
ncbi:general substrate transporter [Crucibulum laeve]|uniref:General substrate transporter n=1 Tax=Crucibulum laeve TaxID=68775 RepID=A0A5C3M8T5_9AGAR|nr:general substrate transporter [Crucibulum laeve]